MSARSGALYHPQLLVDDDDDNVFILDVDVQVDVGPAGFSAIAP